MNSSTVRGGGLLSPPRAPPYMLLIDVAPRGWAAMGVALCDALCNALCLFAASNQPDRLLAVYTLAERHQCVLPLLVTVVSARLGREVIAELDDGLRDADLRTLQRLLVLQVSDPTGTASDNSQDSGATPCHIQSGVSLCEVELRVLPGDTPSLESFFKLWLFEAGCERETLRIILPNGDAQFCLVCDVHQRLIDPEVLQSAHGLRLLPRADRRGPVGVALPQTLQVLRAVSTHGVCGSVLYGLPSILCPTACWELDWDQLESNQEDFHAVCHCLQAQELSLIACSTQHPLTSAPHVLSHFIITASGTAALLLRPAASRELLLPVDPAPITLPVPERALLRAQAALRCLPVESVYNPLLVTGNLYQHLQQVFIQPARRQAPPRYVAASRGPAEGGSSTRQGPLRQNKARARASVAPLPLMPPAQRILKSHRKDSAAETDFLRAQDGFLSDADPTISR